MPGGRWRRAGSSAYASGAVLFLVLFLCFLMVVFFVFVVCCFGAAGDSDLGVLVDGGGVLGDEFGWHREFLCAEVAVCGEGGVGALGEGQFEGVDGGVGDGFEGAARGDPRFADEGRADQVDRDAVALEHDDQVGNASPPCETKYAGPSSGTGMIGVVALAVVRRLRRRGSPAGLVWNCAAVHAFWRVGLAVRVAASGVRL